MVAQVHYHFFWGTMTWFCERFSLNDNNCNVSQGTNEES